MAVRGYRQIHYFLLPLILLAFAAAVQTSQGVDSSSDLTPTPSGKASPHPPPFKKTINPPPPKKKTHPPPPPLPPLKPKRPPLQVCGKKDDYVQCSACDRTIAGVDNCYCFNQTCKKYCNLRKNQPCKACGNPDGGGCLCTMGFCTIACYLPAATGWPCTKCKNPAHGCVCSGGDAGCINFCSMPSSEGKPCKCATGNCKCKKNICI